MQGGTSHTSRITSELNAKDIRSLAPVSPCTPRSIVRPPCALAASLARPPHPVRHSRRSRHSHTRPAGRPQHTPTPPAQHTRPHSPPRQDTSSPCTRPPPPLRPTPPGTLRTPQPARARQPGRARRWRRLPGGGRVGSADEGVKALGDDHVLAGGRVGQRD